MSERQNVNLTDAAAIGALFSKDELIAIHKAVRGYVGDTARTSKQDYCESFVTWYGVTADKAVAQAAWAAAVATLGGDANPAAVPAPATAPAGDAAAALATLLGSLVNEQRVKQIADDAAMQAGQAVVATVEGKLAKQATVVEERIVRAIEGLPPKVIEIRRNGESMKMEAHTHPIFEKALKVLESGLNLLLVGPAGCGKTFLAAQLAAALKVEFGAISGSAGASESHLSGWLLPIGEHGKFEYVPSLFVNLYEKGNSLFLLDEIDAFDPNMLLQSNMATANGGFYVPQRHGDPFVKRGQGSMIVAAANTYGTGADAIYVGRNQLDAATLDRYYVLQMDYDAEFEKKLAPKEVVSWVHGVRSKAQAAKLRRVVSTRAVQKAAAALSVGIPMHEVKRDLLAGWTRDELTKVGEAN